MFRKALIFALAPLAFGAAQSPDVEGMVAVESPHSVSDTQARLETALEENGLTLIAVVNHEENAASVDLDLRPTRLLIFGNPQAGTPLMQASQTVAIDLPQKMLIWEDDGGTVWLAYNDVEYLKDRHDISGMDELFGNIANALQNLADAATSP